MAATREEHGFTLMELLVATTLLGILMVALFGGLRLGTRVWEASDRTLVASEEGEVIRNFLRTRLEQTLPVTATLPDNQQETLFRGEPGVLRFASSMPISLGSDLFLLELLLKRSETSDRSQDLVLRWRPIDANRTAGTEDVSERVLIEDVAGLEFGYFGRRENAVDAVWASDWQVGEVLPVLIRLNLQFPKNDRRRWPPLIVSPKVDVWYDTNY